jgi:GT2 family glycosyltransferase
MPGLEAERDANRKRKPQREQASEAMPRGDLAEPPGRSCAASDVMTDVSIIIVSWNAKRFLLGCLDALEAQKKNGLSLETIVVDNASSDGTPEAVAQQFPGVRLIQSGANLGFAKGNNIGIQHARGKYLCLINSDVVVLPGCLRKIFDYMEVNPDVAILGPRILGSKGETQRSCMRFPSLWNQFCRALALDTFFPSRIFGGFLMRDFAHDQTRDVDILNGCFWIARREAVGQVGPLDERFFMYGEDMDWCRRFRQAGWRAVFCAEASAIHYGGSSSANAPERFHVEQRRANLQYWLKHHSRLAAYVYSALIGLEELTRTLGYGLLYLARRSHRVEAGFKVRRSLGCLRSLITRKLMASAGTR